MEGTVVVTRAGEVSIHTYVAPERGWRVASHLIELPSQLVLFDAQLTFDYAAEVMDYAAATGKTVTRCYISHAHPDHFAGAMIVNAPTYALASQKELIDRTGDLRIARAYRLTPGHDDTSLPPARPVDQVAEAGDLVLDGVRLRLRAVLDAETTEQLTIGLPDQRILLAQDVVYHDVHSFIAEHNFASWSAALDLLASWPYDIVLPGHGLPGDRQLYAAAKSYLTAAATAFATAAGPGDLSERLAAAYPGFGGQAMQGLQNFYLYPSGRS